MATPIVTLDFETYYDGEYSLSKMTTEEYIRDPRFEVIGVCVLLPHQQKPQWIDGGDKVQLHRQLHELVDWSQHAMLAHNTAFDGAIAAWHFDIHPKLYLDTMSMAQPHYGLTTGCSLSSLAKTLGVGEKGTEVVRAIGKHRRDFTPTELAEYAAYCANDTVLCKRIFEQLLPATPIPEIRFIDEVLRCFIDPVVQLDAELLQAHLEEVVARKETYLGWAMRLLGLDSISEVRDAVMSNDKLARLLTELGVDPPKKYSLTTGKLTHAFAKTDEEFLALKEHDDEAVQTLVECRLQNKSTLEETRTRRLLEAAARGPLPIMLKYYAALTGRLGGGDAINMQNLPRKGTIRRALVAPPNHLFTVGDLSQIEARILAAIAGQDDVVEAFRLYDEGRGPDIYCITAAAYLGRPITKADKNERQLGKVIRLALGYGMGLDKFIVTAKREGVILSTAQADHVHRWFRASNEFIPRLWRMADHALDCLVRGADYQFGANGCIVVEGNGIRLPSGRMLRYPGLEKVGRGEYSYMNRRKRVNVYGAKVVENICQSLAGSVCGDAWLRLRGHVRVVMQVHDELVTVGHESLRVETEARVKAAMSAPVPWLPSLPVACSVGSDVRYGDVEK